MSTAELILIAISLSMDAFAVSICKGLAIKDLKFSHSFIVATYFGLFQALMPLIGYLIGVNFITLIESFDHWIAFFLLASIGVMMIKEAFDEDDDASSSLAFKTMIVLAVATSIDALAVGVSFALLDVNIIYAVLLIGITTFTLSAVGVRFGSALGSRFRKKAEIAGGAVLILIGFKILLEHLGFLS